MKNLGAVLATFCCIFLSVSASSEPRVFGIGHYMTTAEILDELTVRNWLTEEEAIPTFQVLTDWAPLRRSEFELKNDEERAEYYDLVQGWWRDPFKKKIEISNQDIELYIDDTKASVSFKCGEKFQCANFTLYDLYQHLGCDDSSCKVGITNLSADGDWEILIEDERGNEYILADGSLTLPDISARISDNIDTVYQALGFYICEPNDRSRNAFVTKEPCVVETARERNRPSMFD